MSKSKLGYKLMLIVMLLMLILPLIAQLFR